MGDGDSATLAPIEGFEVLRRLRPGGPAREKMRDDGRPAGPVLGTCPDAARAALAATLTRLVDVLAGRRPRRALRAAAMDPRVLAGINHRLATGGLPGASLRTVHPAARPCGTRVEFVGSYAAGGRVRALAGSMTDTGGAWTITALRFM